MFLPAPGNRAEVGRRRVRGIYVERFASARRCADRAQCVQMRIGTTGHGICVQLNYNPNGYYPYNATVIFQASMRLNTSSRLRVSSLTTRGPGSFSWKDPDAVTYINAFISVT